MAVTKRYNAPKFWAVKTKEKKYVVTPASGPHSKFECIPLGITLRDILGHARTMNESRSILLSGTVKVNNIVRKEHNFPVGLMDTLDIGGDFYRVVPSKKGLMILKIDGDADIKLAKIDNKTSVSGGKTQLNFHDGTNMLVEKGDYKTSDVVAIDTRHSKITETIKFEKGSFAVVTGGNNTGFKGTIEFIDRVLKTVVMAAGDTKLLVPIRYVFVVGKTSPLVNIG
ncbi:MAG: small subunit ribosomal protein S4e [archaeon GW2011_AR5]|nr:MAG: small subunit ribosomal protein S4e [archaeon GW2011_AR5]